MSHFSVLVIGDDIEGQLQPYHEFECTGDNDEFVKDVDITEEVRGHMTGDEPMSLAKALSYHGLEESIVDDEAKVQTGTGTDDNAPHKWGYAIVKDGQLIKAVDRTNPNKKWDWWVIGGRWSGFLKLKPGAAGEIGRKGLMGSCASDGPGRADVAKISDVDLDGMRDEAGAQAAERFDKAMTALQQAGAPTNWRTWEQCRDEDHKGNIDAARDAYHAQPSVAAIKKAFDFWAEPDSFLVTREAYIAAARDRACVPYALVKGGEWIAKGRMGWFGMSDDKVAQADWNSAVNTLLDSLPPDTVVTVVDCHI